MIFGPSWAAARLGGAFGAVAQLVAHLHGMQGVRGSSPLSSTLVETEREGPSVRAVLSCLLGEPFDRERTLQVMDDEDAADWASLSAGDPAGLARLFDRHAAQLFRHAARLLTDREDAKDAVAIAFFELWRKRNTVRLVGG